MISDYFAENLQILTLMQEISRLEFILLIIWDYRITTKSKKPLAMLIISFFIYFSDLFLRTHCRCRGVLL